MTALSPIVEIEPPSAVEKQTELIREVQDGLRSRPRSLQPWMLYDERGSKLFEQITALPEYYPARIERSLLERYADSIVASACGRSQTLRIVELGAGSASKTCLLLAAAERMRVRVIYVPLDVSADALDMACRNIERAFPRVPVEPLVVNYVTTPPQFKAFAGSTLALYLGSSIGNFSPTESRTILRNLGSQLDEKDTVLLGTDLAKDEATMIQAYDDKAGVTAAFNLNLLNRLNRELNADFNLDGFKHCARWDPIQSRIEMHLESTRCQDVQVPAAGLEFHLGCGETIHTENSYKFTDETLSSLLLDSGFEIGTIWEDKHRWYQLTLSRKGAFDECV